MRNLIAFLLIIAGLALANEYEKDEMMHKRQYYSKPYSNNNGYQPSYSGHNNYQKNNYMTYSKDHHYGNYRHYKRESGQFMENIQKTTNSSQCVYSPDAKTLSCKGPFGTVECDAFANYTAFGEKTFYVFGIGKIPDETYKFNNTKTIKYFLYPRSLDNKTYFNYSFKENGNLVEFYLYYAEKFEYYGFRVTSFKCYEKMIEMFKECTETHVVKLENNGTEVTLFGEILNLDKEVRKRWLWGYYWPAFSWGWGGWGGWGGWWGRK